MNRIISPRAIALSLLAFTSLPIVPEARAVEALLLQDTYVDNGASDGESPSNDRKFPSPE